MRLVIREEAARDQRALARTGFVNIGRRGRVPGTRELVEAPYGIVYTVDDWGRPKVVTLLAVMHAARRQ